MSSAAGEVFTEHEAVVVTIGAVPAHVAAGSPSDSPWPPAGPLPDGGEAHPGATEPHPGAIEPHPGGREGAPHDDRGTATAEYAIATLAACGFGGMLVALLRSDQVRSLLSSVIERALSLN